ncbi:hypothetical protein MNB_SV-3-1593 [hydrothermal vent metagenome]|uniref:Uncharacterized protein n=1 Tax=hydrothermal vent metagenome TaxID=652676 RepID=A0A1W1CAA8_9ZZZZ
MYPQRLKEMFDKMIKTLMLFSVILYNQIVSTIVLKQWYSNYIFSMEMLFEY